MVKLGTEDTSAQKIVLIDTKSDKKNVTLPGVTGVRTAEIYEKGSELQPYQAIGSIYPVEEVTAPTLKIESGLNVIFSINCDDKKIRRVPFYGVKQSVFDANMPHDDDTKAMYEFYQAVESGEMTWSYYDRKNATMITAKSLAVMEYEQRG